ncbi:TIGR04084 family radical SAM/SPASM domain-containing protein [Geoglobus acetivorans]|uniref:Radical SAM core domain-containing protein n=1 Tax=Geoglobus acetivorans TaxID=565033 RepID=A0A0A7GC96_GEOAI|nr:hypothetical protein GACE_0608 [Geoglobus acetivorans]
MLFIVMLTGRCNLNCIYCGGSIDENVMPRKITYDPEDLIDFLNSMNDPSIAFYGGEPLLEMGLMKKLMDEVEARHFIIQTNGLLLNRLEKEYIERFSTILVSVDGVREVTDFYRGGVYTKVLENARKISGYFNGELIARMVASQKTDIYRDVIHLLNLGIFTHVHWQIDAVWSAEGIWDDFSRWLEAYKSGISRLSEFFMRELEKGVVPGIVPFLGVLKALIFNDSPKPPCGSGTESFAITTDGRIVACPIAADLSWNHAGDIYTGIARTVEPVEPCPSCRYYSVCGGRCLFTNRERLWGDRGFRLLCDATIHLIREMELIRNKALSLAERGIIELEDLNYPKYNNTTEIIP